jgi:hypothetical protein
VRALSQECYLCKRGGARVRCSAELCGRAFHPLCAHFGQCEISLWAPTLRGDALELSRVGFCCRHSPKHTPQWPAGYRLLSEVYSELGRVRSIIERLRRREVLKGRLLLANSELRAHFRRSGAVDDTASCGSDESDHESDEGWVPQLSCAALRRLVGENGQQAFSVPIVREGRYTIRFRVRDAELEDASPQCDMPGVVVGSDDGESAEPQAAERTEAHAAAAGPTVDPADPISAPAPAPCELAPTMYVPPASPLLNIPAIPPLLEAVALPLAADAGEFPKKKERRKKKRPPEPSAEAGSPAPSKRHRVHGATSASAVPASSLVRSASRPTSAATASPSEMIARLCSTSDFTSIDLKSFSDVRLLRTIVEGAVADIDTKLFKISHSSTAGSSDLPSPEVPARPQRSSRTQT